MWRTDTLSLRNKSGHFFEACRTLHSAKTHTNSHQPSMVIKVPFTMMDWIHSQTESFTGLTMEGKVLWWKWYLSEFLHNQDVSAKGSVPSCTEEIAQLPITPIPKPLTPSLKEAPIGLWGSMVTAVG